MGRVIAGVVALVLLAGCAGGAGSGGSREQAPSTAPPGSVAPAGSAAPTSTAPFDYCAEAREFSTRFGGLFLVPMLSDAAAAEEGFRALATRSPRRIRDEWRRVARSFGHLVDGLRRSGLAPERFVAASRGDHAGLTPAQVRAVRRDPADRAAVAAAEQRAVDDVVRVCGVNLYRRS